MAQEDSRSEPADESDYFYGRELQWGVRRAHHRLTKIINHRSVWFKAVIITLSKAQPLQFKPVPAPTFRNDAMTHHSYFRWNMLPDVSILTFLHPMPCVFVPTNKCLKIVLQFFLQ